MKHNDAELIERILEGDQHAFALLVERYQDQIHTLVWQKIGDFHIAQEITQDVFISAYHKLATLKHRNRFSGWLYVIANRKCITWYRKKKPQPQSLEEVDPMELEEACYLDYESRQREEAASEKRRATVQKLLSKLRESDRTVITLHYLAGLTCEEIGRFLGVSTNAVKIRLHRARNLLRKEEAMIQENQSSFQVPKQMVENIMKEISHQKPIAPSTGKPFLPWVLSGVSAILVFFLLGVGAQYLYRFQKPYSLNAQSEPTIEIVDAQIVLLSPAKPAVINQVGRSDVLSNNDGTGQKPDTSLFAAAQSDEAETSKPRRKWAQTKGPEGGVVFTLFTTDRSDVYAATRNNLYRLTDDGQAWKLIYSIKYSLRDAVTWRNAFGHVAEWHDTLYRAVDSNIFASTDRGETWTDFCECIKGELVGMVITDEIRGGQSDRTIYLAYKKGVFRSDNFGKSWTPLPEGISERKIGVIANIGNTVFVGTDKGLYRLNGDIWTQLSIYQTDIKENSLPVIAMAVAENRLYAVTRKSRFGEPEPFYSRTWRVYTSGARMQPRFVWQLYRTDDRGASWHSITPKLNVLEKPLLEEKTPVRIAASNKQVIVKSDKEYFYSMNAGQTWKTLDNTGVMSDTSALVLLNKNTFYRSGVGGIHRTTDGGKTWHQFNNGFVNTLVQELIAVNGTLFANTTTALVSSTDGGESWTPARGYTSVYRSIMESNGDLYVRDNGGLSVRDNKIGSPRFFRFSAQDNRLIAISEVPAFKKYDLKKVREELMENNTSSSVENVVEGGYLYTSTLGSFAVNEATYYMEYMHKLFKWEPSQDDEWSDTGILDQGESYGNYWHLHNYYAENGFKIAVLGNTVYVGKRDGHLMRSVDQGNTWNYVTAKLPFRVDHFWAIVFAGNSVYVATDKGVVMSGNGTDWDTLTNAKGKPLVMNRLAVDDTTVYGESNQKIYQLNRVKGTWRKTWKQVTPKISHFITCLAADENTLYVGTYSSGVLRFTLDN